MIVDSLTHVTPDGRWFTTNHVASEDRLLGEMDAAQVDRAVVVALADHIANAFVLEVCRRHEDRLLPGLSFNPAGHSSPSEVTRAARAELQGLPAPVLKLHPRLNRYDPLDPRCLALLEEVAAWRERPAVWLDTLFHYREGILRKPPVEAIHELLSRFPSVRFVLLHGTGAFLLQLAQAVRDCPNALIDLSFTLHRYRGSSVDTDIAYLAEHLDRKLALGSDFPEYTFAETQRRLGELVPALSEAKRRNLWGDNIMSHLAKRSERS